MALCRTVFFWHAIGIRWCKWLFNQQSGRNLTFSLMNKLMRLLLLNYISSVKRRHWVLVEDFHFCPFTRVPSCSLSTLRPCLLLLVFKSLLFFSWNTSALYKHNTNLICTSTGIIREGGSLTCKGGGWEVAVCVRVGGDSHSVDPHSVSRLKGRAEKERSELKSKSQRDIQRSVHRRASCERKAVAECRRSNSWRFQSSCPLVKMFGMESFYTSKGKPGCSVYHELTEVQLKGEKDDRL